MDSEVFKMYFGISPEKAKSLMERVAEIVNREVHEVITHADFYINPEDYDIDCEDLVKEDSDADGYTCLYDYLDQNSPEKRFMDLISYDTTHGGMGSAVAACKFLGVYEDE